MITMRFIGPVTTLLLGALFVPIHASADVVLSAQSVISAPPVLGAFSFDRTIDQSGLTVGYLSGVTNFGTYVAGLPTHVGSNSPPNFAASSTTAPQNVDFDLGNSYSVNELAFWNYPFDHPGSVSSMSIFTASNALFTSALFVGSFNPVIDGDGTTNTVQVFDLIDSGARFVRLTVTAADSEGFGFSEIAFGVSPAQVPEPSSLVLFGVSLLGFAMSRRRRR
jgi:hypothetical protein